MSTATELLSHKESSISQLTGSENTQTNFSTSCLTSIFLSISLCMNFLPQYKFFTSSPLFFTHSTEVLVNQEGHQGVRMVPLNFSLMALVLPPVDSVGKHWTFTNFSFMWSKYSWFLQMLVCTVKILTCLIFLSIQQSCNWDHNSPPKIQVDYLVVCCSLEQVHIRPMQCSQI